LGGTFAACAGDLPAVSTKKDVTYATDIKPIFDKNCVSCHGPEKQKGKMRLDSLDASLKGGQDGKMIKVGDSAHSDLVLSVAHIGDPMDFMPKGKNTKPLTADEIGLIRAWIDQGAK
jgi:mono/diheme cytochrome c family protein